MRKEYILRIVGTIIFVFICVLMAQGSVNAAGVSMDIPKGPIELDGIYSQESVRIAKEDSEKNLNLVKVDTTGYYDYLYHLGIGFDGRKLVEDLTVAGKPEWLGYSCALYDMNMKLIGIYEFRDIGYGKSLGYGKSQVSKGKSLGDIEAGKTIDIYFLSKKSAEAWGRQKCYMQLIKAEG